MRLTQYGSREGCAGKIPAVGRSRSRRSGRSWLPICLSATDLASVPSDPPVPFTDRLRLAVAAYLARFKGSSPRAHWIWPALLPGLVRGTGPGPAMDLR